MECSICIQQDENSQDCVAYQHQIGLLQIFNIIIFLFLISVVIIFIAFIFSGTLYELYEYIAKS